MRFCAAPRGWRFRSTIAKARRPRVMMLPIPRAGILHDARGMADARAVPGIDGLEITIPRGGTVVSLPEGDRYLGFLLARGDTPALVEAALRAAHARLDVVIA